MTGKRRGHGEGAIYRRNDGRWTAVVDIGWRNGKRNRKYLYGKTREEVANKLKRAQTQQQQGRGFADERVTVEQFLQTWLKAKTGSIRSATWTRYEELIRLHVNPGIGKRRIARLTPQQVQELYADVKARRSSTTVLQIHRILHGAFKVAVQWGVMSHNVTEMVIPPSKQHHELEVFSSEHARTFLEAAKGDRLEALYVVAIVTGMREGELLGLRWKDADLERGKLHLVRHLKNRQSRRTVQLPELARVALLAHQRRQAEERRQRGKHWQDHGLVFPNTVGKLINPSNLLNRHFYPLLKRAKLPKIRFHDLRHSCATLLLGEGIHPKIVSELLGHGQISTTLDLYSHVTDTMQAGAAEAMGRLLGGQLGGQAEGS